MAGLKYKLEYNKKSGASDDSVYVHLRVDPQAYYRFQIGKEAYDKLDSTAQDAFANGLFNVKGVEEISVTAYRVWYMKAPAYQWDEVNTGALSFLMTFFGQSSLDEIAGSGKIDGSGIRLESETNRRTT
jgi:hypothetical protein